MPLTLVTAPAAEPVSVSEFKEHSRITETAEDALLARYIEAARSNTETFLNRALITQTWDYFIDGFYHCIEMPLGPLQSVTEISYVDTAGDPQVLSTSIYTVDADSDPGRIYEAYGQTWPMVRDEPKAVTIRFIAGYGNAEDVPDSIKHAIVMLAAHLYENRESIIIGVPAYEVPMGYESLLSPYRVVRF
jgi:uncharacterized phiE125 gp8 family phage protein